MSTRRKVVLVLLAIPLFPWAYFRFVYFPVEIARYPRGSYAVVAFAEPTNFSGHPVALIFEVGVIFGSIHNYTQIHVELHKDGRRLSSAVLARGEDLPEDHLPLAITWSDTAVSVAEHKRGTTVIFPIQTNKEKKVPNQTSEPSRLTGPAISGGLPALDLAFSFGRKRPVPQLPWLTSKVRQRRRDDLATGHG